jgi:hypothetical protein
VISLLNCLGKVVEKVAAEPISTYCEAAGVLHPEQCNRCSGLPNPGGSSNPGPKQLVGALVMDVKGAFDHVDTTRLVKRILELGLDIDLCCWVQSFLADRRIQLIQPSPIASHIAIFEFELQ